MTAPLRAHDLPPTITTRYPDGTVLTGACCGCDWPVTIGPPRVAVTTDLVSGGVA